MTNVERIFQQKANQKLKQKKTKNLTRAALANTRIIKMNKTNRIRGEKKTDLFKMD